MTYNLDNALHGVQEAHTAIFLEISAPLNTDEQEQALGEIQDALNRVEEMIKDYG